MRHMLERGPHTSGDQDQQRQTNTTMPSPIVTVPANVWLRVVAFTKAYDASKKLHKVVAAIDVPDISPEAEERRQKIIEIAETMNWVGEGQVEIDADARLSEGDDNGCYVSGWIWCDYTDTEFDKACAECGEVCDDPAELVDHEKHGKLCPDCHTELTEVLDED